MRHVLHGQVLGGGVRKPAKHVPLLKRAREPALEERLFKHGRQLANGTGESVLVAMMED